MTAPQELNKLLSSASARAGTVAAAESVTAGKIQAAIASVSGSSRYFLGGITAYTLAEKVRHLGVNRASARRVHCVSARVAEEMALGVTQLFGSRYGVATTGYAEPNSANQVLVPFAWWAVAECFRGRVVEVRSGRVEFPRATRVRAQEHAAASALKELVALVRGDAAEAQR